MIPSSTQPTPNAASPTPDNNKIQDPKAVTHPTDAELKAQADFAKSNANGNSNIKS